MLKNSLIAKTVVFLAMLLSSGALFAWGTRCDISGKSSNVELTPEGEYVKQIFWGNEADRKYSLFMQKKELPEGKQRITFSFIPQKSGFVSINFNGCWAKRGDFKNQDKEITRVSEISIVGAELKNADFKELNSQGKPRYWSLGPDCVIEEGGCNVWNCSGVSQNVRATAGQKITVSYSVEYIEFEPAEE
jgi:hypothetical protein